jgi:hypothetical protein
MVFSDVKVEAESARFAAEKRMMLLTSLLHTL